MSNRPTRREFIQVTVSGATGFSALEALAPAGLRPDRNIDRGNAAAETGKEDKARRLEIPIRYIPWTASYEDEFPEEKFSPIERRVGFDPRLCALILVDVWGWHFITTLRERWDRITREQIKPVADACRKAGFLVVHTPSPDVANKHPKNRFWPPSQWKTQPLYTPPGEYSGWPTKEMKGRTGRFAEYSQWDHPNRRVISSEQLYRKYDIHPAVGPEPGDFVVGTREELHGLLTERKRFHLFYVGYVSNGCILERDYGTRQMSYLGYQIILLCDCTTALETSATFARFEQTKSSIDNLEMWFSTSTSNAVLEGLGKIG